MQSRVLRGASLVIALILSVLLSGCASAPQIQPLPARDAAVQIGKPDEPRMPKLFLEDPSNQHVLDELVPYEQVLSNRMDSAVYVLSFRLEQLIWHMPDAVTYSEGQEQVVGVVSQHVGFGVSTGHAIKAVPYRVVAFREAGAVLPVSFALSTGTVMSVGDPQAAGGIKEGDILVQVAGFGVIEPSFQSWMRSMLHVSRLGWRAGDEVEAEWIRPGVGKIQGRLRLLANPCTYRSAQDWVQLDMGRVQSSQRADGRRGWYFPDR